MDVFLQGVVWTPSKMIRRLGLEMKDESSIYHWAARNDIPVFSPALTDGSLVGFIFEDFFFKFERFGVFVSGRHAVLPLVPQPRARAGHSGMQRIDSKFKSAWEINIFPLKISGRPPRAEFHVNARSQHRHDHRGRGARQAPHLQREPDGDFPEIEKKMKLDQIII